MCSIICWVVTETMAIFIPISSVMETYFNIYNIWNLKICVAMASQTGY